MPLELEAVVVGLEASIQRAMNIAGKNAKIDLGTSSKAIDSLSQPLGRITGQADQFGKSMEAANARVLAFGASVGILGTITRGFQEMISVTIQVEKSLANINSVMGASSAQLNKFKNDIFSIAKETGNSFQTVSEAALELSRQGLKSDEVLRRLKDSMVLSRLSGMDAANAVEGLTAAVNSFSKSGITTTEVLNKIAKTAAAYSVSEKDLIEGFKRSASVAQQAGVSLDELGGIITAVQEKTARGGAVIGNAFKTIFTRIQRPDSLAALEEVGAAVTDMQGGILPATKLIENLAQKMNSLSDIQKANITEKIGGGFQIGPLLAALDDLTGKTSTYMGATQAMASAGNEAYARNTALNKTLAASINETTVNLQELANTLGEIGVTDSLKNILSFFSSLTTNIKDLLQGEGIGSDLANGIIKGLSGIITGPGFVIFGAIIAKLTYGLVAFGAESLKAFFGIGQAQKEINALASSLTNTLMTNENIHKAVLSLEGNHVAQAKLLGTILKQNNAEMQRFVEMGTRLAPGVASVVKGRGKSAAGGYMPAVAQENSDIQRGVGGANPSNKPVVIPNFAFGGGKVGTMVANDSEYVVNNYGGSGGSAIFNKDMVSKIGLPSGAQKINSAGGFIPNFAATSGVWADDLARFQRGGVSRQQLSSRYGKDVVDAKIGSSVKSTSKSLSSTLNIDANALGGLGVVSVSGGQGNVDTSQNRGQMSASEVNFLDKSFGKDKIQKVIMSNIQSRSLGVLDSTLKMNNQEAFRAKVKEKFTSPLVDMGSELIGRTFKGNDKADLVSQLSAKKNDPALFSESVLGGIFESAIRVATKSAKEIGAFKDVDANAAFDFEESGSADKEFKKAFGFGGNLYKADAKKTANPKTIQTIIGKALRDREVGSRIQSSYSSQVASQIAATGASGYIPNFANALNEAISREVGAGVDPNKVYIDQNSSLKNSANPMGLMVANRRDEPAGGWQGINRARKEGANAQMYGAAKGFIPNYAKYGERKFDPELAATSAPNVAPAADKAAESLDKVADSADKTTKGQRDNLGTIFAVQMAMSGLSAATAGSTSEMGKYTNIISDSIGTFSTVMFAIQGLGSISGSVGSVLSKLGPYGMAAAGAFVAIEMGGKVFDQWSGVADAATKNMDKVSAAAAGAAIQLSQLSAPGQRSVKVAAQTLMSGAVRTNEALGKVNFEGFDLARQGELEKSLSSMVETSLAAGVSYREMWNQIQNAALSGKEITAKEVDGLINSFQDLINKSSEAAITVRKLKVGPDTELGKSLAGLTKEELSKPKQGKVKELREKAFSGTTIDPNSSAAIEEFNKKIKQSKELEQSKAEEQLQNTETLNIEYNKLLSTLKGQQLYKQTINDLENQALTQQANLLSIAENRNLTDIQRANAIEDANKANEISINLINNQKTSLEGLKGSLEKVFEMPGVNIKDFDKIFSSIKSEIDLIGPKLKEAFDKNDFDAINILTDNIGKNLGGVIGNQKLANTAIREYIESLFTGEKQINKQSDATKVLLDNIRNVTEADKNRTDDLSKQNELLQSSIQLQQQSKDLQIKSFSTEEFAKRKDISSLGKAKFNETSLDALKREAQKAELERGLQPIDLSRSIQQQQQISLRSGISSATSYATKTASSAEDAARITEELSKTTDLEQLRNKYGADFNKNLDLIIANRDIEIGQLEKTNNLQEEGLSLAEQKLKAIQSGVSGGLESGLSKLKDQNEMFAFDLGERIPSMFADNMASAMEAVIMKGEGLGDTLMSAATSFLQEITKANIKNLAGQFTGGIGTLFRANGGPITGGSGTKDDVPAMLMGGEYVMNKKAVSKYGPQFMEKLNNGKISHFASGGAVGNQDKYKISSGGLGSSSQIMSSSPTQTGEGGFYMPGYYGAGTISGKKDLLSYASQAYTSGAKDIMTSGRNFAGISLEGESAALTNFGRTQGPMAQAIAESKGQSFDLYKQQIEQEAAIEKARKDAIKARQKGLKTALITAVASAAISGALNVAKTGFQQGIANGGGFMGGVKGVGEKFGNVGSSLNSLFKGDMQSASQYSNMANTNFNATSGIPKGILSGLTNNTLSSGLTNNISSRSLDVNRLVSNNGLYTPNNASDNELSTLLPPFEESGSNVNYNRSVLPLKRATGGPIPQIAGIDTVPAMLSGGEFIMNQAATQRIGPANLNSMNSGTSGAGKDSKELNDKLISKLDELIAASKESGKGVTVNVASNGKEETKSQGSSEQDKNLSRKIKEAVVKVLQEEKRLGGVLRRS